MLLDTLRLGQCAFRCDALHKIHSWAPAKARSYTITKLARYEYGAFKIRRRYFEFTVEYYSAKHEGRYLIGKWSWNKYCLHRSRNRFPVLRPAPKVSAHDVTRRIVMGESTAHPDRWRHGEKVEP